MSIRSRIERVGRRALTVPQVRRVGVAIGRRSPRTRELVKKALGVQAGESRRRGRPGKTRIDIRGGRMMLPDQAKRWPIVVFVALGLGPGDADRIAAGVERAQFTSGRFRPLFLIDSGEFAPFRSRNYAVEAVMNERTYAAVNPHDSYGEYVYERTEAIVTSYGARAVVPVATGSDLPAHLARVVGALDI